MTTVEQSSVVLPADWVPGPPQGSWTYDDYAALPNDGQRYEIVNGVLVMAPAPTPEHQDIVLEIVAHLRTHIKLAGLGRVFPSPVDVDLGPKNIFQPDVVVVLNAHLDRVTAKKIVGAPDLVVEVLSRGSEVMDRIAKYAIYAHAGIPEYWIVKPATRTVEVLVLENGEYRSLGLFHGPQMLLSQVVPAFPVAVEQFFV
ncbi:MAG TPA: Uma2 family endonuclease [Ktedonobacteraceae bacterium]